MNYYKQVAKIALPQMACYTTDVTEHDQKNLKGYEGEFLYGIRDTGTDLYLLDTKDFPVKDDLKKIHEDSLCFLFRSTNNIFLYGKDGKVVQISRKKAQEIAQEFLIKKLLPREKLIKDINLGNLAFQLHLFIQYNKRWKNALHEQFDYGSSEGWIRKIRNYCFNAVSKIKSSMTEDEIKYCLAKHLSI